MQLTPELLSLNAPSLGRTPDICVTTGLTVKKLAFIIECFITRQDPRHLCDNWCFIRDIARN